MQVQKIRMHQEVPLEDFEHILNSLRYEKTEFVSFPGQFAVRGGVIDIYPVTYRKPVRLEFANDKVVSIHDFAPVNGETTIHFDEVYLIPVSQLMAGKKSNIGKSWENYESVDSSRQLERGDIVVHLKYGIGRYLGTKGIQIRGEMRKHLAVEYAGREILYFGPSEPLERYIGSEGAPPKLTKLNTKDWERVKTRTRLAVNRIASDLLELQALREMKKGYAFAKDHAWQKDFESEFPFEETPDQNRAVDEVKRDMESSKPMDRLLCGDVGYGKTEVAMRAAFKAVTSGKQVAVLVPTTVLAEQHHVVLKARLRNFPVTVEALSRFKSKKEQLLIVATLKTGVTDIVIGTHRLLSRDVIFKNLGLVIIDEEQRFGVKHKERLKELRELVDILTLTATPIPRTLYMSMVGVRDMSLINTPPKNRMPIQTYVMEYDDIKVKRAFEMELSRAGQIYFVHNRVQSIEKIAKHLMGLMPQVRFGVAHGQMNPHELESIMTEFLERKIDCLISTNIIESGIDIPNVNTILVNRADTFGLAELYQLRGRVGRYQEKRQAYAYFLVPKNWMMTQGAEKRLAAIERFTDLGSGFRIALEDLEIRGAGNLLGHEQSGFIHAVGFDLYCRMLRKAVDEQLKAKHIKK